jgi:hypothetical protein
VTALAMSNAPVKVVQSLVRHSTPTLALGVYAHVGLYDQTGALDALPDLTSPQPGPESVELSATGTDGREVAAQGQRAGDGKGRNLADTDRSEV